MFFHFGNASNTLLTRQAPKNTSERAKKKRKNLRSSKIAAIIIDGWCLRTFHVASSLFSLSTERKVFYEKFENLIRKENFNARKVLNY
jgi:hypothetical protein